MMKKNLEVPKLIFNFIHVNGKGCDGRGGARHPPRHPTAMNKTEERRTNGPQQQLT